MCFILIAKSFLCGIALLIPGVGATSAAITLGVLDKLNYAISSLRRDPFAAFSVLIPVASSALLGASAAARPIALLCEKIPMTANLIFLLLSMSCTVVTYKKYVSGFSVKNTAVMTLGILFAFASAFVFEKASLYPSSSPMFILCGIISSVALILPGLSFSYTLLCIGIYDRFLNIFYDPQMSFVLPFMSGLALGTAVFLFLCKKVVIKCGQMFYSFICGMMLYSAFDIFKAFFAV